VILINLLPHREATRKKQKEQFFTQLGLAALLGGIICGGVFAWYQSKLAEQESRNSYLVQKTSELDLEIKDIANLQDNIASLRARQLAVENLQSDRNMPVLLLESLVTQLPDGIYLSSMKQQNRSILLEGIAQSQERVSELLRNLGNNSPALERPELIEIVSSETTLTSREKRKVANFKIRVQLTRVVPVSPDQQGEKPLVAPGNAG